MKQLSRRVGPLSTEVTRELEHATPEQLAALDTAQSIDDMDIPGFRLHPLKGNHAGRWSITVNGNWRMTFEFVDGNAYVLDYEDYH